MTSRTRKLRLTEQMNHAPIYNSWVRSSWHPIWLSNACRTYATIERIFEKRNADVSVLPRKDTPLLILASGPSLDDWRPYIRDWKYDIYCSTSQLSWLESAGVNPQYIFLIDADPTMNHLLSNYKPVEGPVQPSLITHPCIQREAIESWGREDSVFFFRMLDPGDEFFTKFLPMMYQHVPIPPYPDARGIKTYVMNSGNVMNCMLVFGNQKGHNPIILAGYDLGYPEGQYRFQDYEKLPDGSWKAKDKVPVPKDRPFKPSHNGVLTDELCIFYKYSTMIMYGMAAPNLLSSARGIVDEIPYVSPQDAVAGQFPSTRTMWDAYKIAQEYLRPRKVLITRTGFSVSVNNMTEMKPLQKIKNLARWHYWRNRSDWEAQSKRYAAKQIKKDARAKRKAARSKKKAPYDLEPVRIVVTQSMPVTMQAQKWQGTSGGV